MKRGVGDSSRPEEVRHGAFADRRDAGRKLAARLDKYAGDNPIVLALPRGGVPVGYEIAKALHAPLDVFVVRKLGAPQQPELGIGAIAPGGLLILDADLVRDLGIPEEVINRIVSNETAEMERRLHRFRGDRPLPDLKDRTVLLVDDGLATGVTAYAAIKALRQVGPRQIVLAIPVCATQTAHMIAPQVSEIVCLMTPPEFLAVGLWYANFEQTSDEEVIELLEQAGRESEGKTDT